MVGRLWISNLGRIKWTVQAEIITNNQIAAKAIQMGAFVSLDNNRPIPIPEELHKYVDRKR